MQLVLISHRRGATLQIADVGIIIRHNQRAFKLTGAGSIDSEIRAKAPSGISHP